MMKHLFVFTFYNALEFEAWISFDLRLLTRCQISCSMQLQCVSKILTPGKMLKKTSLIAKINRWNKSFRNMYDMH